MNQITKDGDEVLPILGSPSNCLRSIFGSQNTEKGVPVGFVAGPLSLYLASNDQFDESIMFSSLKRGAFHRQLDSSSLYGGGLLPFCPDELWCSV